MQERMLTHAAETAVQLRDAKRKSLRESLEHGARIESGPLKVRLNRRRKGRRRDSDDSYFALVVYV